VDVVSVPASRMSQRGKGARGVSGYFVVDESRNERARHSNAPQYPNLGRQLPPTFIPVLFLGMASYVLGITILA
jgi:hypothetical protein